MLTVVVVGGGMAGLVSALELRRSFRVVVIEKEPVCGGLLRSSRNRLGASFDCGTHILSDTGIPELDRLLFDRLDAHTWNHFDVIRAGTYFAGRLSPSSVFPDVRSLPKTLRDRAEREILAAEAASPAGANDLHAFATRHFGPTIAEHVIAPIMRKQFAVALRDLVADNPFAPRRVVCFDAATARALKKEPRLDSKVAFHANEESAPGKRHHYPREGGIGRWAETLCADLVASGVRVLPGKSVLRVEVEGGRVGAVGLDDGTRIPCAHLVWTVPPFALLKRLGLEGPASPPIARPVALFHFSFDRPFLVENYYITCYDEALRTFRVTLYPNLREDGGKGGFNCTAEVIGERGEDFQGLAPRIRQELTRMELVEPGARALSVDLEVIPTGFPALTHDFVAAMHRQRAAATRIVSNVTFLGRAKTTPFFMDEVVAEAFHEARRLTEVAAV